MAKTYTLVTATWPHGETLLIGSPVDGDQSGIDAAIAGHREMERDWRGGRDDGDERRDTNPADIALIRGCVLTDDEPADANRIAWRGHEFGWLIDENGETFEFAIRPYWPTRPATEG